jgi:hypothetical protein
MKSHSSDPKTHKSVLSTTTEEVHNQVLWMNPRLVAHNGSIRISFFHDEVEEKR